MDIWSRRYRWSSLRSVANLVSSFGHNRFEGHFGSIGKPFGEERVTMVAKCEVLLYANSAKGRR